MFSFVWKNVVIGNLEFEDYIVSHAGCIKNSSTNKVMKQYQQDGHMYVDLDINNEIIQCKVDVLVMSSHYRKPLVNETINHINGKESDCGMMNLDLVTV